jgi:hypothetical protein
MVVALVAGTVAFIQRNRADTAAAHANAARVAADQQRNNAVVARLVADSENQLDSHLDLAMLLAVEARRHQDSPETKGALFSALTHNLSAERSQGLRFHAGTTFHHTNSSFLGFLPGPVRLPDGVALSADGRVVANAGTAGLADTTGLIVVHDTTTHTEVGRFTTDAEAYGVDVRPDGSEVIASDGNTLYVAVY